MKRSSRHYLISGRVQGVGYRAFVHRIALRLEITGRVRNLLDGRVEAVVTGTEESLRTLEAELRQGPARALVERLDARVVAAPDVWENFSVVEDGDREWSFAGS